MDIDTMPAGRELDALIAEKVMGLPRHDLDYHRQKCLPISTDTEPGYCSTERRGTDVTSKRCRIRPYSTDIAAAMEVWHKAFPVGPNDKSGFPGVIQRDDNWCFTLFYANGEPMLQDDGVRLLIAKADTAPLSICRAALKACL